jgi:hypothetical protein
MRQVLIIAAGSLALLMAVPASAFENFIPMGTGYSTEVDSVPSFDSDRGEIIQQSDIYETELYLQKRREAETESRLNRFFSDAEISGGDRSIDY